MQLAHKASFCRLKGTIPEGRRGAGFGCRAIDLDRIRRNRTERPAAACAALHRRSNRTPGSSWPRSPVQVLRLSSERGTAQSCCRSRKENSRPKKWVRMSGYRRRWKGRVHPETGLHCFQHPPLGEEQALHATSGIFDAHRDTGQRRREFGIREDATALKAEIDRKARQSGQIMGTQRQVDRRDKRAGADARSMGHRH